jgi:hypothetical protein
MKLTTVQRAMLVLLGRYDRKDTPDPIHLDTYDGNVKRTLKALERAGRVETWQDADDSSRLWAALPGGDEES